MNYDEPKFEDIKESLNGISPQSGMKVANVEGDKTIQCWSCSTIMIVKEEWNVVQCPNCEKVCKIPEDKNSIKQQMKKLHLNGNLNHFDVDMPFVYAILICPYCRTDNKVRVNSEHMVCYKCHNSMNITKTNDGKIAMSTGKYNPTSNYLQTKNSTYPSVYHPHQKSLRFSDLFFPDPMFYPGIYPSGDSFSPLYPKFDPQMVDEYFRKRARYEAYKYQLNKNSKVRTPVRDKLEDIKRTLNVGNQNYNARAYDNQTPSKKDNNSQVTGFEDKIEYIKEKLSNSKKERNQAIYNGVFENGK
jgi:hypothetical protein